MLQDDIHLKKLSLWQVIVVGVAYMTPMTVFDTFGIVSGTTEGHVPLAYLFALVAMLLTAFSYARFSRVSEKPGSAYTYTAESCGSSLGFFCRVVCSFRLHPVTTDQCFTLWYLSGSNFTRYSLLGMGADCRQCRYFY